MGNELSDRQAAIRMRLAGESIANICRTLKRSKPWFHKWWKRYLALGPEGLYDLTRANQRVVNRTPPHIEPAILILTVLEPAWSRRAAILPAGVSRLRSSPPNRACFSGSRRGLPPLCP